MMSAMSTLRLGTAALVFAILVAACSATEDPGDPEAFCALLRDGIGLSAGGTDGLDALEAAAPPEIRSTVRELANTVRSLDEIPDDELGELFSAAFDPEAVEARNGLRTYAVEQCGSTSVPVDQAVDGVVDEADAEAQLASYIATNFGTTTWAGQLSVDAGFAFGRLDSLHAEFADDPDAPDDALAACNALAVFLYEIESGSGEIRVTHGDTLLAGRSGPSAPCVRP
jgi:hypothetical protein